MMKYFLFFLVTSYGLTACGQSGPLYFPKTVTPAAVRMAPSHVPETPASAPAAAMNTSATS